MQFTGREQDLSRLAGQWRLVTNGGAANRGQAIIISGRRRVGKSRLIQEFVDRTDAPAVVFQATQGRLPAAEMADLIDAISQSDLPGRELVTGMTPNDWTQTLRLLAACLPDEAPSIVVLDEVPWLMQQANDFEGALQTAWDQYLSTKPVLLLLIGSDASIMASLQEEKRAFFGRAATMLIEPLPVSDVQDATDLGPADAIDAWLVTGGFPGIVASWQAGQSISDFLAESLANPLSPLLVSGQLTLLGEFPQATLSRDVLEAIGSGERTFSAISKAVNREDALRSGSLSPILKMLEKRAIVTSELPLSTQADTKNRRYRITDPYLRFWLAFGPTIIRLSDRGRPEVALEYLVQGWSSWRGRAIEPFVRGSLERLLPNEQFPQAQFVGGWWNRQNNPEVDLIGADKSPVAHQISFIGSIKWRENQPFDHRDYVQLAQAATQVPGATEATPLIAVSRQDDGSHQTPVTTFGPRDLVDAWRPGRTSPVHSNGKKHTV